MKKIVLSICAVIALAVAIVSCTREMIDALPALKSLSRVKAVVSETPLVKSHLENGTKIVWDVNDQIGIFSDTQDVVPFTKEGEEDVFTSGTPVDGNTFYAFFPYSAASYNPANKKVLSFVIDDATTAGGPNPVLRTPLIAKSNTEDFSFKHTCAVLHFAVSGTGWFHSLTLKGNNSEKIGGTFTLNLDNAVPELEGEGTIESLKYTPAEPVFLSTAGTYDVYFVLPPLSFDDGFSIIVDYEVGGVGHTNTKKTDKAVTLSRATIRNYALVDLDQLIEDEREEVMAIQHQALIALYDATNGANWNTKTNWCSSSPINEWHGVTIDQDGYVTELFLAGNNLTGTIPAALSNLSRLSTLCLSDNSITGIEAGFTALPSLYFLTIGNNPLTAFPLPLIKGGGLRELYLNGFLEIPDEAFGYLSELIILETGSELAGASNNTITIPNMIGDLAKLSSLALTGYVGDIPESLYNLSNLVHLSIRSQKMTGEISPNIGKLTKLRDLIICSCTDGTTLDIPRNHLSGSIPSSLFSNCTKLESLVLAHTNLTGAIPSSIGNCAYLRSLSMVDNFLTGNLPVQLCDIPFTTSEPEQFIEIQLSGNDFSGKVPAAFKDWVPWQYIWDEIIDGSNLDISEAMPPCPNFTSTLLNGASFSSTAVADNELTILFQWDTNFPDYPVFLAFLPTLKSAYKKFHNSGLEVIGWSPNEESSINTFLTQQEMTGWKVFHAVDRENTVLSHDFFMYGPFYPTHTASTITIFNKNGQMVWSDRISDRNTFKPFLENFFNDTFEVEGLYTSTDFSKDGTVTTIQTASEGAGIDIVLMADGFSDRQIDDGSYLSAVNKTINALFAEEPYKSNKNKFNIYMVTAVSPTENYVGDTALGSYFGNGTYCGGDNDLVLSYADNPFDPGHNMDDCLVIVLMNQDRYAGTCHYITVPTNGDYGRGNAIAYISLYSDLEEFGGTVRHEAGGHGFAKLADEYSYTGTIPTEELNEKFHAREPYGWWRNVDFTSDPAQVKWSAFLNNTDYAGQGLGVFEGACTYLHGAYRATSNSIMNTNTGGFNAPSRFAIWYRINKLADPSWTATFNDVATYNAFVTWDIVHPYTQANIPVDDPNYIEKYLPPLAPPVFDIK